MPKPTIDALRDRVSGKATTAADDGYDEARAVYNAMIDRRPAVIASAVDEGEAIVGKIREVAPVVNSTVHLDPINGAAQRFGPDDAAFGHRDATFAPVIAGMWPDPADNDANIAWV